MCRLLAYAAPAPSTFTDVIGTDQGVAFQRLARLHSDGWGAMWVTPAGRIERERTPGHGYADSHLANALNGRRSRAAVAHLRMATGGLAVDSRNSHPFLADGIGMAHNGSILPVGNLAALVSDAFRRTCQGSTDSELYFALVRERVADGLALPDAVAVTVTALRDRFPDASLNAMVLGPDELVVVRASTNAHVPHEHFLERGLPTLPPEHDAAYYDLRVRVGDDGTYAFASSGLDTAGWDDLPLDSMTVVDLASVTARTVSLDTVRAR